MIKPNSLQIILPDKYVTTIVLSIMVCTLNFLIVVFSYAFMCLLTHRVTPILLIILISVFSDIVSHFSLVSKYLIPGVVLVIILFYNLLSASFL